VKGGFKNPKKKKKGMKFTFQKKEKHDLLISWLIVSLAFGIMMIGGAGGLFRALYTPAKMIDLILSLLIALGTVGIGVIIHELAHKWIAHQYKLHSEYKADKMGLILTIISSLFTIVIAAPGAVHMHGHQNQEIRGKVALAGPAANIILALLFFVLTLITNGWLASVFGVGAVINAFFGLFNLIPFAPFDGMKVFNWHKGVYIASVIIAALLSFITYIQNSFLF
jgi:Zn-dependent protease